MSRYDCIALGPPILKEIMIILVWFNMAYCFNEKHKRYHMGSKFALPNWHDPFQHISLNFGQSESTWQGARSAGAASALLKNSYYSILYT